MGAPLSAILDGQIDVLHYDEYTTIDNEEVWKSVHDA